MSQSIELDQKKIQQQNKSHYFNNDIEMAAIEYRDCQNQIEKDRIYSNKLYHPIDEMITKLMGKLRVWGDPNTNEELKAETHYKILTDALPEFDPKKGKAFSLLTRVTLNFLLGERIKRYKKKLTREELEEVDVERNIDSEETNLVGADTLKEFIQLWTAWYDTNLYNLGYDLHSEIKIVDSVIELFKSVDQIEIFNRKALYVLIRERTGCSTLNISPVVKKMRNHFDIMYKIYLKEDKIYLPNNYNKITDCNDFW